ncbi:MAG: hypothetical protein LC623_01755, partial [Halobacteriales archaeon]|nr:hypothetical protein [Halobacteriales archaeon]
MAPPSPPLRPSVTFLWALLAALAGLAPPATASCQDVDVHVDGTACGNGVSVSVFGDASGSNCSDTGAQCISISATGDASNTGCDGVGVQCIAVAPGSASNSGTCEGAGVQCVAVGGAGAGNAGS